MNPIEIILETIAEWVMEMIQLHNWTVLLWPVSVVAAYFAGLMIRNK